MILSSFGGTVMMSFSCSVHVRLFATPFATSSRPVHAENTPNERRDSSQRAASNLLFIGDLAVSCTYAQCRPYAQCCTHTQRLPHFTTALIKSHFRSALQPKTPQSTACCDESHNSLCLQGRNEIGRGRGRFQVGHQPLEQRPEQPVLCFGLRTGRGGVSASAN